MPRPLSNQAIPQNINVPAPISSHFLAAPRYNLAKSYFICGPLGCVYVTSACLIGSNYSNFADCNYAYALGAAGIFMAMFYFVTRVRGEAWASARPLLDCCS